MPGRKTSKALRIRKKRNEIEKRRKKRKRQAWEKYLRELKYRCSLGIAENILNDHKYITKFKEFYEYDYDYDYGIYDTWVPTEPELIRIPPLWLAAIIFDIPDVIHNFEDEKCPCQTIKFLNNEGIEWDVKYYESEEPKDIQEYLHIAIEKNRIDCVKALLKKGAIPNRLGKEKSYLELNRPWIKLKKRIERYDQMVEELRESYEEDYPNNDYCGGFRFYCEDHLGGYYWDGPPRLEYPKETILIPPLCVAAQTSIEMTRLLIESGADPLDTSLVFSHERCIEKTKYSAIYYAASTGHHLIIEYLQQFIISPQEAIYMLLMDDKKAPRKSLPDKYILKGILEYAGEKEPVPDFSSETVYRPFIDLTKTPIYLNRSSSNGCTLKCDGSNWTINRKNKLGSVSLPDLDYSVELARFKLNPRKLKEGSKIKIPIKISIKKMISTVFKSSFKVDEDGPQVIISYWWGYKSMISIEPEGGLESFKFYYESKGVYLEDIFGNYRIIENPRRIERPRKQYYPYEPYYW